MKASPIFTRSYDFLQWLIPATVKFPRQHRFVLAQQLQQQAFALESALVQAGQGNDVNAALQKADHALSLLRTYLRLAQDLNLLQRSRYEHGARMLDEIGRLLGGWKKKHNVA